MATPALLDAGGNEEVNRTVRCIDCSGLLAWRSEGRNLCDRRIWKVFATCFLLAETGAYLYVVRSVPVLFAIGALSLCKFLIEAWGQDTATWVVPNGPGLFFLVYITGIPYVLYTMGVCGMGGDITFPYHDLVGFALFTFGSGLSLSYEMGRFRWKQRPENKGRLHTVGLARLCMHPNYLGDLFTYSGWAIAGGSLCGLSLPTFQVFMFLYIVVPNSDAYLAKRYANEFPAYAAKTGSLIPFVHSALLKNLCALAGLAGAVYLGTTCGQCL